MDACPALFGWVVKGFAFPSPACKPYGLEAGLKAGPEALP